MKATQIKPDIYWVGAKDWNLKEFHGYQTHRGTTYNAYLIVDKKIVLVDTVKHYLYEEMLERIKSIIDPSKIDYIICNHVEMDHSGSVPRVSKIATNAEIIASPNGDQGLKEHFFDSSLNIRTVKSGESINIGRRSLQFIHIPMVHWPDSMVTFVPEEKLLLSSDAFGQHYSSDRIFNDECPREIIFEEAARYYANIVYPYGAQVNKALIALANFDIDMIAPGHGVIWRDSLEEIIGSYKKWATYESDNKALVVYDTMWNSTEILANAVKSAFEDNNIPVTIRSLSHSHYSDVITDVLESKYIMIGSATLNNEVLPNVAAFLTYLKGLKPKNKIGFVFGSYGWATKALKGIEDILRDLKWEMPVEAFSQKYVPKPEEIQNLKLIVNRIIEK